jgi:hypothetical protein
MIVSAPLLLAAKIFSLIPPTGMTFPVSDSSPVMASLGRKGVSRAKLQDREISQSDLLSLSPDQRSCHGSTSRGTVFLHCAIRNVNMNMRSLEEIVLRESGGG